MGRLAMRERRIHVENLFYCPKMYILVLLSVFLFTQTNTFITVFLWPYKTEHALPPTGLQGVLHRDFIADRWMKTQLTTILWAKLTLRTEKTSDTMPALSRAQRSDRSTGIEK